MSLLDQKTLLPDFIKMRWLEPYVSHGLNRKTFKTIPRGFYNGFIVRPGPGVFEVTVHSDDVSGWGPTTGYSGGNFDSASGWSVAVHADLNGHTSTIAIQAGVSGNFTFDLSSYVGTNVYLALDVQYEVGYPTTGQIKLVQEVDLDTSPMMMVIAKVEVPVLGPIADANIIYDDPAYPRVLPFANKYKYGYMSAVQADVVDIISSNAVSGAPVFEGEVLITFDGPQDVTIPGGYTYVVNGLDLWVFKNGLNTTKGASRDYIEVDRGDGRGEKVTWVGTNLRAGDRIKFRVQKYAVGLTSTLQSLDEGTLIESNTIFMNFKGSGVSVQPDGYRRVKVVVPGGGGGGSLTRSRYNLSGGTIVQYSAVHLLADCTMVKCDPTNPAHKFYGIVTQSVPNGSLGDVQIGGVLEGGAGAVSGASIMDNVYISFDGNGSLTTIPPDPLLGSVFRVGFLDGADAVSGGGPSDIVFDRGRLV